MTKIDLSKLTFYTVWLAPHGSESHPWQAEWGMMRTVDDVAEHIDNLLPCFKVLAIFRHDYDVPHRDVTEDIAEHIYREWRAGGGDPETDVIPAFAFDHMPTSLDSGYRG